MNNVWILVCDGAHGRLFETFHGDATWRLIEAFEHPESRSRASELVGDHLGQSSAQGGGVHHNALAPSSSPKEVEKGHFVHTLATRLDQAMRAGKFKRWVLVAPPHVLGMVKKELTPALTKHLMGTVEKDLARLQAHELAAKLADVVRIPLDQLT